MQSNLKHVNAKFSINHLLERQIGKNSICNQKERTREFSNCQLSAITNYTVEKKHPLLHYVNSKSSQLQYKMKIKS